MSLNKNNNLLEIIDVLCPKITLEYIANKLKENCKEFLEKCHCDKIVNAESNLIESTGYFSKIYQILFTFINKTDSENLNSKFSVILKVTNIFFLNLILNFYNYSKN